MSTTRRNRPARVLLGAAGLALFASVTLAQENGNVEMKQIDENT